MGRVWEWTRNSLALVGVLAFGFWLGAGRAVKASTSDAGMGVQFQMDGISTASALLVYQPETRTIYVYQGATVGSSNVQCSYKFQMTRPGEVLRREPCPIPDLNP